MKPFSMHNRFLSWLFLGAAFALISLRAQSPGTPAIAGGAERVLAARVTGTVEMTVGGQTTPVKADDRVPQSAKIITGKDSSIVLVFSNGATTQLGSDTELIIEEFLQDPFANTVRVAEMTEEPSRSRTRLALNRGELVGTVKKLKHAEGSTYTIVTPVGAAGIRGTTFRIVFRPVVTGQAFGAIPQPAEFSLTTLEGDVRFQQGPPNGAPGGAAFAGRPEVPVRTGQEILLNLTVTRNAGGQFSMGNVPPLPTAVAMGQATAGQMAQAAQRLISATTRTSFAPNPNAGPISAPPRIQPAPRTTPLSGER